ncbi:interleukin-4 receptor subunit alpha [Polymixia lowei]
MTMELRRFLHGRMSFILLMFGNILCVTPFSGRDLQCYNDYEEFMFCQFNPTSDQPHCPEYRLTITDYYTKEPRPFKQCEGGLVPRQCHCSVVNINPILDEKPTVKLWNAGNILESKVVSIEATIKPKTPSITEVKKSGGAFQITWTTYYNKPSFTDYLTSMVTYKKKGETNMVSINTSSTECEISGRDLKPSTEYLVSVKTNSELGGVYSDSSNEMTFQTDASFGSKYMAIIISFSVAAIIFTSVLLGCFFRFKTKWWDDAFKYPNPELLNMVPGEKKLLQPSQTIFSFIYTEPIIKDPNDGISWSKCYLTDTSSGTENHQQSSGTNTDSSLGYADIITNVQEALRKALPDLGLMSSGTDRSVTNSNRDGSLLSTDDFGGTPSSFSFENMTYSILIPNCQNQIMSGTPEIQLQPVMPCDLGYQPGEGAFLQNTHPHLQVPACLFTGQQDPNLASHMQTDFSYQPSVSSAEDTRSYNPSEINAPMSCKFDPSAEAGCGSDEAVTCARDITSEKTLDVYSEEELICDVNPCCGALPSSAGSPPAIEDDYQPFHSVVKQPNVLFSGQCSSSQGEQLEKYPKEFSGEILQSFLEPEPPNFICNAQGGQCPPALERPFQDVLPTGQSEPVATDFSYHSV